MQSLMKILVAALLGTATLASAAEPTGTWYLGAGVGQSRAKIEDSTVSSVLPGAVTAAGTSKSETSLGAKAFLGYQFNRYIAVEGGYFRLGQFSFDATTAPAGTLHGDLKDTVGYNLDVIGTAPIVPDRFLLLARAGVQTSKTSDLFFGTGAATNVAIGSPSHNLISYKYGVGAEFDFTKNIGVRGEFERYRVSDGFNGKMNVNSLTASLLYRF